MSRVFTSDGAERGDLKAFNTQIGTPSVDTTSQVTGANSYLCSSTTASGSFNAFLTGLITPTFTANAEVFAQARIGFVSSATMQNQPTPANHGGMLMAMYSVATIVGYVTLDGMGFLRVLRADNNSVLATAAQSLPTVADFIYLIQFRYLVNGATGAVEVKVNGASMASASGINTLGTGPATINAVGFGASGQWASNFAPLKIYLDDALVNVNDASGAEDGYAQDIRIARAGPGSAGHITGLTAVGGTNLANVQPVPPSDSATNYNDTSTAATYDSYAPGTEEPVVPTGSTIVAVSVDAEVLTQAAPQNGKLHVYTHATDYASAAIALPTSYGRIANRWLLNPNTGVAWTLADALAAEMGVGLA